MLLGTLIGVLPGIGATATIAMLLPITFQIGDPVSSLIMLAGIYYGAQYGGSTTAILINMPGESSSAVTAIDGYQMARNGRAGAALAIAAIGSFFAGTVATFLVALFAPPLTAIALQVRLGRVFLADGRRPGVVGRAGARLDRQGARRWSCSACCSAWSAPTSTPARRASRSASASYADGLNFVAVAVGVFGVAEILRNLENEHDARGDDHEGQRPDADARGFQAAWSRRSLRGTAIGSLLGILPGGGAILAVLRLLHGREARLEDIRRNSARARSTASPGRNRPTMPAPRPRSSRC